MAAPLQSKFLFHSVAFNVLILNQKRQQAGLTKLPENYSKRALHLQYALSGLHLRNYSFSPRHSHLTQTMDLFNLS